MDTTIPELVHTCGTPVVRYSNGETFPPFYCPKCGAGVWLTTTSHVHRWTTDLATNRMESTCGDCGKEWAEYVSEREAATSGKPDGLSSTGVPAHIPDTASPSLDRWAGNQSDARLLAEDAADLVRRTAIVGLHDRIKLAQAKALAAIALSMAFREERDQ